MLPKKTKEERLKEKKKRKTIKKKAVKKISAKKEKEKLDKIFSIYIRLRDCLETTGSTGLGHCFTCGKSFLFDELQCGHFFSRKFLPIRFDDDNCHIQCAGCNVFKSGNYIEYTTRMIDVYGRDKVEELREKSKEQVNFKALDYIRMQGETVEKIKSITGLTYKWGKAEGKSYKKWVTDDNQ